MIVDGWTESRYWGFLRGLLRRGFQRFPNKYKALARSKKGRGEYECASCRGKYKSKEVSVDHIIPCGSLKQWEDLAPFIKTLFCTTDNLQVLCKECHDYKSLRDRGMSDEDIELVKFKKLCAADQREVIERGDPFGEVGSNQEKRIEQYKRLI